MSPRRRPAVELPAHVRVTKVRGRPYYYFQRHRGTKSAEKPVRLPDDPRDPAWWAAYAALMHLPVAPRSDTVAALIKAYKDSPDWRSLAHSTRVNWSLQLSRIEAKWGPLFVRGIRRSHVIALRDAGADRPGATNNMLRALSVVLEWGRDRDWIDHNPCIRLEKLAIGDGYEPWPEEMLELVRVHAPDWMRQAVCLARCTGQRRADVLAARWDAIRGSYIRVRQEKTHKQLDIRIHRELSAELATMTRAAITILTSTRKRPWTGNGFGSSWRKALVGPLAPIANAGLTFHGLRKNAVTELLEAGCSEAEVASVTGQSQKMIAHYAKRLNQRKLSDAAISKWERTQNE